MPKEFRFHEHNFQNNPGDTLLDMNRISAAGWEINAVAIGFPYLHALWQREVRPGTGAETVGALRDSAGPLGDRTVSLEAALDAHREVSAADQAELATLREQLAGAQAQIAEHSSCQAELSRLSQLVAERESTRTQLEAERDQARNIAREQQAARQQAESERDQLRAQLTHRAGQDQPPGP